MNIINKAAPPCVRREKQPLSSRCSHYTIYCFNSAAPAGWFSCRSSHIAMGTNHSHKHNLKISGEYTGQRPTPTTICHWLFKFQYS